MPTLVHIGIADLSLEKGIFSPLPGRLFAVATSHSASVSAGRCTQFESDGTNCTGQGSIHINPRKEHFHENCLSLVDSVILIHSTNCGTHREAISKYYLMATL